MPGQDIAESRRPFVRWARALALVAVVAAVCVFSVRALTPKVRDPGPADIKAHMDDDSLALDDAVEQVNKLDVSDRRDVMRSAEAQAYFQRMQPGQRLQFVRRTLDRGIQDQIERYRKLDPEGKKAFIEEAQERQQQAREQMNNMTPEQKKSVRETVESSDLLVVVENAVRTYLKVSSSEERAELAPLFDGALDNLNHAKGL